MTTETGRLENALEEIEAVAEKYGLRLLYGMGIRGDDGYRVTQAVTLTSGEQPSGPAFQPNV